MTRYIWINFCLLFLLSACQPSGNAASEHNHEGHDHSAESEEHEEHESEKVSLFNENTELFVEFPSLMLGHSTTFLVHLTHLENYKPYPEGKLTLSLIKGSKGIRQKVDSLSSDGLFTPSISPKEAGIYSLVFDVESKYGKERFTANNIRVYKDHAEAEQAKSPENENGISFSKEQAWKIDFGISEVQKSAFQQIIKTTGSLIPSVNMEKRIVAKSDGIVHFQSQDIVPGKTIQKNESIFHLSGKELAGNNISTQFTEAKSNFEKAQSNFERAKALHEDQIISEKEYWEAKSNFETANANYQSIREHFHANGVNIVSPVSGFICGVYVNEGQYVEKGDVLAKVDQGSKLLLKADIYQKQLQELAHIKSANFRLPYSEKIFDTDELHGRLIAYGKDIHEDDYTTPLYFEVDLRPELYAGSFIEVYLKSERSANVLHIEKSAILEDHGLKYVFVQESGENYEKRFVTIGHSNGKEVEITSGLQAGEHVVSKGAYFVKLASMAGSLPAHDHNH
jgi:RND family efflux transporter MFP subunit